jgi:uncharacterized protein YdeI (YjbR/CyaY-like superfamily)
MEPTNPLFFKDPPAFRAWLEENHDKANAAWIYMYKVKSKKAGLRYKEALEEAICFGWIDGQVHADDENRFVQRWTPRRKKSPWSKKNRDTAEQLIKEGRMTKTGLAKIKEAKKNGNWQAAYTSKKKMPMPPELEDALKKDPTALKNFQNFANTYQNMYIGWIASAKRAETKNKRIEKVVEAARQNRKMLM